MFPRGRRDALPHFMCPIHGGSEGDVEEDWRRRMTASYYLLLRWQWIFPCRAAYAVPGLRRSVLFVATSGQRDRPPLMLYILWLSAC